MHGLRVQCFELYEEIDRLKKEMTRLRSAWQTSLPEIREKILQKHMDQLDILLTVDGKGKLAKLRAIHQLVQAALSAGVE